MLSLLAHDRANEQEKSLRCSEGSGGASACGPGGAGGRRAQPQPAQGSASSPWAAQPCSCCQTAEMRGKRNANPVRSELAVIVAKCCSLQNQSGTQRWVSEAAFVLPLPQLRAGAEPRSRQWVSTSWAVIAVELTSDILLKIGQINPIISSSPACFASRVNTAD